MTGVELRRLFEIGIDAPYTGYYDPAKLNRLLKESLIMTIQDIYRLRLDNQNAYDQISFLIAINNEFPVRNGILFHAPVPVVTYSGNGITTTINTSVPHYIQANDDFTLSGTPLDGQKTAVSVTEKTITFNDSYSGSGSGGELIPEFCITDYMHYLWAKALFSKRLDERITSTTTSPVFVTLDMETEVRDGDYIRLSGGLTGNAYVKQHNERYIQLFNDEGLTSQFLSTSTYSSGIIHRVMYSVLKIKRSDEKEGAYGTPSAANPYFQMGELAFFITPSPEKVIMDYIKKPPFDIDTQNSTIDLSGYYPEHFLYKVVDMAIRLAGFQMRDGDLVASATEQIVNNP